MKNKSIKIGSTVKVMGTDGVSGGTANFPIPARFAGRTAVVADARKRGRGYVYDLDFGARRVAPLTVLQSQITLR